MADAMQKTGGNLAGLWRSFYRYPSSSRGNDAFWGRHTLQAAVADGKLRLESVPGSKSRVVIELTLAADKRTAEGTWQEETEPESYYKGAVYDGTITFNIAADGSKMSGIWHGKGKEGEMNSDVWELTKINEPS